MVKSNPKSRKRSPASVEQQHSRPSDSSLTGAEAEVMNVIWRRQPTSVPEIVESIARDLAYTTVMTTVRILEQKGFVKQCGKRGRAFLYEAVVDQKAVRDSMSNDLVRRLFDGSVKSLLLNLVEQGSIDAKDLAEVRQVIEQLEAEK